MERYICVHGHFYQPPRENAWLEYVETQDSAHPHHDWNQRVTAQCYGPNTAARLLDKEGFITEFVNNYGRISFDFGPTLLKWLDENDSPVYRAIIASDTESRSRFSGHGSALAQPYNHLIMPLASHRDKETQVRWGTYDFEHRFGRKPEGMWLPETAVDLETLEITAAAGITFTILAPQQAKRTRRKGESAWNELTNADIDTTLPYELRLPSGRTISLFFYNGAIAGEVAFKDLLANGQDFANRLISALPERTGAALAHIATDGESYGHHRRFGEMALAFALRHIERYNLAKITNYAEFLEKHPPEHEVEIHENTSWSCPHGIERWRSNDGCNAGRNPKWNQVWRAPLRETMDWLRDSLAPKYEAAANELLRNPWAARDDYIEVILDRTPENVNRFLKKHQAHELTEAEIVQTLKLMEMARHSLLMYTSDGWFFDELSGVETVQTIQYAGRTAQLAEELFGGIEEDFLRHLEKAKSNIPERGDGRRIYQELVKPLMVGPERVAAHFAVSHLFQNYAPESRAYCYQVTSDESKTLTSGDSKLVVGRARLSSIITRETVAFSFGGLHQGNDVTAGTNDYGREPGQILEDMKTPFSAADFARVADLIVKHFGSRHSLSDLFRDDRRQVMGTILDSALASIESAYHQAYPPPIRPLNETGIPIPKSLKDLAECLLNDGLRHAVTGQINPERIQGLLEQVREWQVEMDKDDLSYHFQGTLETMMAELAGSPGDAARAGGLKTALEVMAILPFPIDLWRVQSLYHGLRGSSYPGLTEKAQAGDRAAGELLRLFDSLGDLLKVKLTS